MSYEDVSFSNPNWIQNSHYPKQDFFLKNH